MDDAFYQPSEHPIINPGEYKATIVDLQTIKDVKFGGFIADIFKPTYLFDNGSQVFDNGVFRYRKSDGYNYDSKRNWGYAKFCSILKLGGKEGKSGLSLPSVALEEIEGYSVLIKVFDKKFKGQKGEDVSYPVARLIKLNKKAGEDIPF